MRVLAGISFVYFAVNTVYTALQNDKKDPISLKQWILGVSAGFPIAVGTIVLIWGIPMILPEKFRVGGERIEE